ncbi:hypothetical protein [Streptomyces sp. NPDC059134]|uniref:hypothetical protein n=1 Tax=Streptomyces sp. NPDC059134 TaxID=3346738 RepID=UPI003687F86F
MTQGAEPTRLPAPQPNGLEIAMQWAELPPEHLRNALAALEPQLAREHEYRMAQDKALQEANLLRLRLQAEEEQNRRTHNLYMVGLIAGFIIALGMLTGAVVVGVNGEPWLAASLSGPSVLALAGLFVLRKSSSTSTGRPDRTADAEPESLPEPTEQDPAA